MIAYTVEELRRMIDQAEAKFALPPDAQGASFHAVPFNDELVIFKDGTPKELKDSFMRVMADRHAVL